MAIDLEIPGLGAFHWTDLVLDVNGTLTTDGVLIPGVAERLDALSPTLAIHLLTADTRGVVRPLAEQLGVRWTRVERGQEAEQKRDFVAHLGAGQVIAVGNGNNDALMLAEASLGIAVLGAEGVAVRALLAADILVREINDALDLLRAPLRLLSTLRR